MTTASIQCDGFSIFEVFALQVETQIRDLANLLVNQVPIVFVAAVTTRDKRCFQKLKQLNELLRDFINYTYIPLGSKMSSMRNICDDGVHLSENGVTNLITTLVKFL